MKLILIILLFPFACFAQTNYFVAAGGNDAANGLTPATAWQTLAKVNSFTFANLDTIKLNGGDIFFGTLTANRNGLNFRSYGTGKPIIKGSMVLSTWVNHGNGIWSATVPAKYSVNLLTIDSLPQTIARYPDADAAGGGYIDYKMVTDTTKIIVPGASALRSVILNKVIAIRSKEWRLDRDSIVSVSLINDTVTYVRGRQMLSISNQKLEGALTGNGAFYMGDSTFLTKFGEWLFKNGTVKVFFGSGKNPSEHEIEIAIFDTLFNAGSRTNISIADIDFYNPGRFAFYCGDANNITVKNCNVINSGAVGINTFSSNNVLIDSCVVTNALSIGIHAENNFLFRHKSIVKRCSVSYIGMLHGMGSFNSPGQLRGIVNGSRDTVLTEYNRVHVCGKSGITFAGNNVDIRNNIIDSTSCVLGDDGGIYTFVDGTYANPGLIFVNRNVYNNTIFNCKGAPNGSLRKTAYNAVGIYLDGRCMNVNVYGNNIFNVKKDAIHANSPTNINIHDNNIVLDSVNATSTDAAPRGIGFMKYPADTIINLTIKKNIIQVTQPNYQSLIYYTISNLYGNTLQNIVPVGINCDSNFYTYVSSQILRLDAYNYGIKVQNANFNLQQWQTAFGHDLHSYNIPAVLRYKIKCYYNDTRVPKTFNLTGVNTNLLGQTQSNTLILQPFTSVLYVNEPGSITPPDPTPTLQKIKGIKFLNSNTL